MNRDRDEPKTPQPKKQLDDGWKRYSFTLPMLQARAKVSELLRQYPKAGYETHVEAWKVLASGKVEFVVKHRPDD